MPKSTQDVINHHLEAFGSGSVEGILEECYTDDSVMISSDGVLKGKGQIRTMIDQFIGDFSKPGASFEMGQMIVEGEVAYITWTAETADIRYDLGSETYLIRDGKIAVQTVAIKATPKA